MTPEADAQRVEERVLVLAPTGRDALLACDLLSQAGLQSLACADENELCQGIEEGAAVAVLAEEALHPWTVHALLGALSRQGPWSDLPLIVFTRGQRSSEAVLETLGPLGNATLLERPVRVSTLVSSVKAGMRARRRQYEVRDLLQRQADADRRKDEFLAMLGHELRNPLAAIRNAIWILEEAGSAEYQDVRQREVIERQTHHLVRMVDDLLDVSRVTLGKIDLHVQPVDLQNLAERCLSELGMKRVAESHELSVSVTTEPVLVQGDPVRLEQVVCNLLHNAIKYTPRGGSVELTVGPSPEEPGEAVVRVRDTGLGISEDMLTRIFEPFTQVESSRKRSEGGLGLGLPLVRSLVQLHGGTVEAKSEGRGRGSEFIVRLPRLRLGSEAGLPLPAVPDPNDDTLFEEEERLRILVVEDNHDGRESLRDLLEIWGHEVEVAENGPDGVRQALGSQPDVALIDIGLPGLDGNEVAQRIRAALDGDRMALVAMTGYGQPEDRRRALQAGFDAYLVKPVDPGDLARTLRDVTAGGARLVRN
ncbi:MAG TPA: ATP-binding protein [Thermoanaerobaculia bacterium]|nr:ATP-binding protein [Thermoanaerobaculia bacterium]